ncbi:MAG: Gfo/Idh/MocA family oxidoreductase [Anaerolineaceae bacterium]|nr:Gfo/Idh/MocA family oxidoreductase [Anaerolineaceae bacterium]
MKTLICGLGSIGRRHLRNLVQLGQHDILLYRTGKSTLPEEELEAFKTYGDLDEALAQKPEAVVISNPSAFHIPVALAAARAGANLMIEKPISNTLEGLKELDEILHTQNKQALVGFHFRYHPVLQQIKAELESGNLGRTLSAQAHWGEYLPAWHPYEDYRKTYAGRLDLGGGVTLTLSHPIDYLRWMFGEVEGVSASLAKLSDLEIDVEDNAEITLHFKEGAIAHLHLDYYQQPPIHSLQILCSQGVVQWENSSGAAKIYSCKDGQWRSFMLPYGFERNDLFLAEMKHFMEVCEGAKPICTLQDGAAALQVALMAHDSSHHLSRMVQMESAWRLDGKISSKSCAEERYDLKRS